jgi:hypothetical protein
MVRGFLFYISSISYIREKRQSHAEVGVAAQWRETQLGRKIACAPKIACNVENLEPFVSENASQLDGLTHRQL